MVDIARPSPARIYLMDSSFNSVLPQLAVVCKFEAEYYYQTIVHGVS